MRVPRWFIQIPVLLASGVISSVVLADDRAITQSSGSDIRAIGLAIAATLASAAGIMGAAYAVSKVGAAAMGAAAEKPELLSRSIVFVALAEGLAILGFAIAMVLAQKI